MKKGKNSPVTWMGGSTTLWRIISLVYSEKHWGKRTNDMWRTQQIQCRSSSKSFYCRESFVSFPYRVGHILASHSHIILWMLPNKPVTVQISDSHGPGNNESPHAPVTQVTPTPPISLHADQRHLFGSTGKGWKNQAGEGVRAGVGRDSRKKKRKFGVFSLVSFAGQLSNYFIDHSSKHFFLYSQSSCFWLSIRTLARSCGTDRVSLFLVTVLQASGGVSLICSGSQVSLTAQWNWGLYLYNLLPASLVSISYGH